MQTAKDFSNLFIDGYIYEIIEGYEEFRKEAIRKPEKFETLYKQLKTVAFEEQWKENVYEKFSLLLNICKRYQDKGLEYARDELNECMNSFIIEPIEYISGKTQWMDDFDIRYKMLYLMLDIIYAYSDKKRNLHFSAVVWNKISDMGNHSSDVRDFYGRVDIVGYALDTLSIKYRDQNLETMIREIRCELNNNFSKDFCQHLLNKIQLEKTGHKGNSTASSRNVNTINQTQEDALTLSSTKKKKRETDGFLVFCMIIIILIALLSGVLIGSILDIGDLGMSNSKKVIQEQEEEIQSLNSEIRELERELRELKRKNYQSDAIGGRDSTQDQQRETEIESEKEDITKETETELEVGTEKETEQDNNDSGIHTGTSKGNN